MSSVGTSQARCSIALLDETYQTPRLEQTFAYCSITNPSYSVPPPLGPYLIPPDNDSVDEPPLLVQTPQDADFPPHLVVRSELHEDNEDHIVHQEDMPTCLHPGLQV